MSNPRTFRIESWADFSTRATNVAPKFINELTYIYRGQSDERWSLEPSLHRQSGETERSRVLKLESALLKEFEARVHLVARSEELLPKEPYQSLPERWAVMQHHGAPTRLVDWTRSAFVAAYFAVESNWAVDGAIYVISAGLTAADSQEPASVAKIEVLAKAESDRRLLSDTSSVRLHTWFPRHMSERLAAQQGLFLYAEDAIAGHEQLLGDAADDFRARYTDAMLFDKYVIPAELKREFLTRLRAMNIGAHSLFPGLDGLGRFIAESARIGLHRPA